MRALSQHLFVKNKHNLCSNVVLTLLNHLQCLEEIWFYTVKQPKSESFLSHPTCSDTWNPSISHRLIYKQNWFSEFYHCSGRYLVRVILSFPHYIDHFIFEISKKFHHCIRALMSLISRIFLIFCRVLLFFPYTGRMKLFSKFSTSG